MGKEDKRNSEGPPFPEDGEKEATLRRLRAQVDRIMEKDGSDQSGEAQDNPFAVERIVHGREVRTPFGSCYVVQNRYDLGDFHGSSRLREALMVKYHRLARLLKDRRLIDLDPADGLYLDTETTGLVAREGAFAFMIGLGFFDKDSFHLWQIFLREAAQEPAALHLLSQRVDQSTHIITFNGKNFDLPLLDVRLRVNRMDAQLSRAPHVDLLYPARRLWKYRLESCSLASLERAVLDFRRQGDIPGFEIPDLYLDYLRNRDARKLGLVFEHNAHDVVSMAVLLARVDGLLSGNPDRPLFPEEAYALGRIELSFGQKQSALAFMREAIPHLKPPLADSAMKAMSKLLKRQGHHEEAAVLWRRMIQGKGEDLFAFEQLAIHFEHRLRDFAAALDVVLAAEDCVVFAGYGRRMRWKRRKKRLEEKIALEHKRKDRRKDP